MANAKSENGAIGFAYLKPPEQTTWEKISTTLYNKSDNTVLGRTGLGWARLLVFYSIFYLVLAALFAICFQGLFATLDYRTPKWILDRSLIGTNPGMGFRPISNNTEEGSLIWYDSKNATTVKKWVTLLDKFLLEYTKKRRPNVGFCDFDKPPAEGKACEVNLDAFKDCGPNNNYGYNTSAPCVFLKLNRIYGWQPEYYNDPKDLPKEMPPDLVTEINDQYNENASNANQIWVSCNGEHSVDKEYIDHTRFTYYPTRGFPGYYYPYTNVEGYLSPIIAVKLQSPRSNVAISIECRAWAKNIEYIGGYRDRQGSVHFELMRDN